MVAQARYIKNRPDLPGPPFHPADSDVSVLRPPIPPLAEAVADAQERLEVVDVDPAEHLAAVETDRTLEDETLAPEAEDETVVDPVGTPEPEPEPVTRKRTQRKTAAPKEETP